MQRKERGGVVLVRVSAQEVEDFNSRWPCSTLPERNIHFTFDKKSGDLVDISPDGVDGPEAVALAEDAQRFAGL